MASKSSKTNKGPGKKAASSPDDLTKGRKGKTAELSEEELKNVSGGAATLHKSWIEI